MSNGYKQWVSKSKSTRLFKHNILLKKKTIQYKNNIVESSLQKVQRHRSPRTRRELERNSPARDRVESNELRNRGDANGAHTLQPAHTVRLIQ